jgi:hypothetical protein
MVEISAVSNIKMPFERGENDIKTSPAATKKEAGLPILLSTFDITARIETWEGVENGAKATRRGHFSRIWAENQA